MPSFFVKSENVRGDALLIGGEEAHHLRVRRHEPGDVIDVVDGAGAFYQARVESLAGEDMVRCTIVARCPNKGESAAELWLAPALIKGQNRFDFLVEKATEIGAAAITPILTQRAVAQAGSTSKIDRWRRLALAATKQCGRSVVPRIDAPSRFKDVLQSYVRQCHRVFVAIPSSGEQVHLARVDRSSASDCLRVGLMVGPEGGFTSHELEQAEAAGAEAFSWGNRTLRTDTAAVVLAAMVLREAEIASRGVGALFANSD